MATCWIRRSSAAWSCGVVAVRPLAALASISSYVESLLPGCVGSQQALAAAAAQRLLLVSLEITKPRFATGARRCGGPAPVARITRDN